MNETVAPPKFGLGARALRKEDAALMTGHGHYASDHRPEGTLEAFVLRSPVGHGQVTLGDLEAARSHPGVHLVWTAQDLPETGLMPCDGVDMVRTKDGAKIQVPPYPLLSGDVVRHVGDAVAFIVADDIETARSAAELIEADFEPLAATVDAAEALEESAPLVWPERGSNLAFESEIGDRAATDAAFDRASKVASLRILNNRLVCNYLEGRAIVAEPDGGGGRTTVTLGTQGVHGMRDTLAKSILHVDPQTLHVMTPDVGGGFGPKAFVYREYPLTVLAAQALGRPVRWVSDRTEHFLSDAQGRDNVAEASLALDEEGRILAMRVDLVADMGAYLSQMGPFIPWLGISMTTGVYDIPALHVRLRGVYTHTVPIDAYRGAGRPEAAYLIERLVDEAARVSGLDRATFRRRNFIKPEQMPYRTAAGRTYDTGDFDAHMTRAMEAVDFDGFEKRAAESKRRGRLRGIGFATYIEACAFAGSEEARVLLGGDGRVTLHIGTQASGQGHLTAYAQFMAAHLGLDLDQIDVVQGDSDALKTGGGTGGSRSIPLGVPSVDEASRKLAQQIIELAGEALETAAGDIELQDGRAVVAGTDRSLGFAEIAASASDKSRLEARHAFKADDATFPNGTHMVELEVDPDTGTVELLRYVIVDDFGAVVNPLLLAGQVHGGIVQGIGQALLEHTVYDADGQLLTASFMDYALPRADDLVGFDFETRNVPSKNNPFGIKGAGEAGSIGSCPAVMNALVDALHRAHGIRHIDMPATPLAVWQAIRNA